MGFIARVGVRRDRRAVVRSGQSEAKVWPEECREGTDGGMAPTGRALHIPLAPCLPRRGAGDNNNHGTESRGARVAPQPPVPANLLTQDRSIRIRADDFAARDGTQLHPRPQIGGGLDETDAPIGEQHIAAARVPAGGVGDM